MNDQAPPRVGIVMGSDSDWPKINKAADALDEFGVPYEVRVMSAHRTPQVVSEYATTAIERGLQVIIAAAGGAAHLAGVVAAHTTLPVIGLPVPTPDLGGLDSLLSTVQMPGDVPVASMAVGMGGPRNAGLFAVQILATAAEQLRARLVEFKEQLVEKIAAKDASLSESTSSPASRRCAGSVTRMDTWNCSTRPCCREKSRSWPAMMSRRSGKQSSSCVCGEPLPSASRPLMASAWDCSRKASQARQHCVDSSSRMPTSWRPAGPRR